MPETPPTAVSGEGHPPYEEDFRVIGGILERDAEQIMERWFERATEEQVHAASEEREEAMDDLLTMLHSVGRRLKEQTHPALEHATAVARAHGEQRAGLGWDIVELVRDYEILQGVILERLGGILDKRLTFRQAMVIATVIDKATGSAVESFSQMTHRRLEQANRELDEQVERQKAELRQVTLDLTDAEHHERQRIARQLHDDLQQMLVAIQMTLRTASHNTSPNPSAVHNALSLVDQTIEVSRHLTADLYPQALEDESLPITIGRLVDTFQQRYGLNVTLELDVSRDSNPGPMPLRRLVYDAVRELLFNVVKHAQTDQAWVRICCDADPAWSIEVQDRGTGSASVGSGNTGFGLSTIRERIKHIGGSLFIESNPAEGTRILLTVPVTE